MNQKHIANIVGLVLLMVSGVAAAEPTSMSSDLVAKARYEVRTILKDGTTYKYSLNDVLGKGVGVAEKDITSYVSSCDDRNANAKELVTGFAFEIAPSKDHKANEAHISWDYKKLDAIKSYKIGLCEFQLPDVSVENGDMDLVIGINESFTIQGKNVDIVLIRTK